MPSSQSIAGVVGLLGTVVALLYQPLYTRALVLGLLRPQEKIESIHGLEKLRFIPHTAICEDLHHHLLSNQLYTACQDSEQQRIDWFPAVASFKDHKNLNTGSLTVIDPGTFTSRKLTLKGFKGPFITHGIDITSPQDDPTVLYIFAVNHLPNPNHYDAAAPEVSSPDKGRSQIEVFRHQIGSDEAEFVRSIRHPLIRTPNDIYAVGPDEFYVTNDHYYREGNLRIIEDIAPPNMASWTDTVFVQVNDMNSVDPEAGTTVTQALTGMHNNNGIGHSSRLDPQEVLLGDTAGGVLHRARRSLNPAKYPSLVLRDSFQLHSMIDNPSYYEDKFATKEKNASGYVLAGLGRPVDLSNNYGNPEAPVPTMVWHLRQDHDPKNKTTAGWTPHLVFQDPGFSVRGGATAVIVGIDPKTNAGKKQGWLFVTGFTTRAVVAAKIDL